MENLLGFIIFVAIVAISIINKIRTEGAEEPDVEKKKPSLSPEDLPEATRRMLYGDRDGGVIVAKPRKPTSDRPVRAPQEVKPHPVSARTVDYERAPDPQAQPQPAPFLQKQSGPTRTMTAPTRQPMAQTLRSQPEQPKPRWQQQPAPARQPSRHPARSAAKTTKKPPARSVRKTPMQPSVAAAAPRGSMAGLTALLASKNDIARGIVLHEILGPPKAFQDFT